MVADKLFGPEPVRSSSLAAHGLPASAPQTVARAQPGIGTCGAALQRLDRGRRRLQFLLRNPGMIRWNTAMWRKAVRQIWDG